ncbi:MAG: hypothetical protein A3F84_28735 [Candidatus Handelsmanbacteria bacterium RIFCSPLOWO2_12_FULL_64_10]|uniref:Protein-glutamate methylesterase/protein-glutamine glutaminase n=1 Tax=Handelsmanbacteria sp. (strain RIFCSPLOWO2_12_FULL_64_10) TaxID=1817868 RepID=A0A1F6CAN2_HANXR|nr:MAG: hypothetical protein A3F84_28735 [Candidatus Handelsmanbacteria bacterium RIFCSPLOWO2_12_FULL_64_10]
MVRVLVADDSAVTREYLVYLLDAHPDLEVVGTARDGLEAVEQAERLRPDVIVMDVMMPRMDGHEATRQIMERAPAPIVMVSASGSHDDVAMTFEAVKAGALAFQQKPRGPGHPDYVEDARRLVETVSLMAEVKVVRRWAKREPQRPAAPPPKVNRVRVIAIGASTGGPQTIAEILGGLSTSLAVPILVVQHIAPGFVDGLAEWLNRETPLAVKVAEPDEVTLPGTVYIAPNAMQMGISSNGRIHLEAEAVRDGFCPSASHLFKSVADAYGQSAMGILLTGMGRDGADGLQQVHQAGGLTVAQDEESSVIFGMPGAAVAMGAAQYVLSATEIVELIGSATVA